MTKRFLARALGALMITTLGFGLVAAQPASAAPTVVLDVTTTADVLTHVGALVNTDVQLDTGTFAGTFDTETNAVNGGLELPAATFDFVGLGLLPLTTTFHVDQVDPGTTGTLDLVTGEMNVTHNFDVRLSSVALFGLLELLDPAMTCKTVEPTSTDLSGNFSLETGGVISGNYAIPTLVGCGFLEAFVSGFTAGPTNSLEVTLGPPTIG